MPDPPTAEEPPEPRRPTAAVVLGSGGARGYAHIGVLQVLAERGVEIVAVAGSSMGAVVGGMHAAGRLDEFTEWAVGLGQFEVLRLMDVSLASKGAIRGEKVFRIIGELLGDTSIEDLPIEFTAVAVDLLTSREVWFQRGPLEIALRASTAIPSFITPVHLNGMVLVDGGVLDPVPVAPVAAARADRVVAVTLNGRGDAGRPMEESAVERDESEWSERFRGTAARWLDSDLLASVRRRIPDELEDSVRSRLDSDRGPRPDAIGNIEVMQMSIEAMQGALTRHRIAGYPPDVLISVPKNAARTLDLHRAAEMIDLGRRLAHDALADVELGDAPAQASGPASGPNANA